MNGKFTGLWNKAVRLAETDATFKRFQTEQRAALNDWQPNDGDIRTVEEVVEPFEASLDAAQKARFRAENDFMVAWIQSGLNYQQRNKIEELAQTFFRTVTDWDF